MRKEIKKISVLVGLIFSFGLIFTIFPELSFAAERGPNACCKLDHNLTEIDPKCLRGAVVADENCTTTDGCWCDWNDDGVNDAPIPVANTTKNWGTCCIVNSIHNLTGWLFYVLLAGVGILCIVGGFYFLTASGDPGKIQQVQKFLFYAGIGLLLALMARILPAILKDIVS